jgi:hypothetical protein
MPPATPHERIREPCQASGFVRRRSVRHGREIPRLQSLSHPVGGSQGARDRPVQDIAQQLNGQDRTDKHHDQHVPARVGDRGLERRAAHADMQECHRGLRGGAEA